MSMIAGCPTCDAALDWPHAPGCHDAQCLVTGFPVNDCPPGHEHDLGEWTGWLPGEAEAVEHGLWQRRKVPGTGWEQCGPFSGGVPDRTRVFSMGRWDRESRAWVIPD